MKSLCREMMPRTSPCRILSLCAARGHEIIVVVAMRSGPAQLVVRTVCVHNHSGIFEQPQTATTTPMSGHELDTHSIDTRAVAGHRMGYYEYVHGAYYGLKYRASQKRYLVTDLRLQLLSMPLS